MQDKWTYFAGMWGFIGFLYDWQVHEAVHSYTYNYCDECGEKGCIATGCQASRMCGLWGWVGDDYLFYEQ